MKRAFITVMKDRIENWEFILHNDPKGEWTDTKMIQHSLDEDKNIVRAMADMLAISDKNFVRAEFFDACGL